MGALARRAAVLSLAACLACAPTADVVITGGLVWTGASSGAPQPGAVAIRRGRILAVGDSAALARHVGRRTEILAAEGGLVMPGFADGHTHFIDGGFQLAALDLRDAETPEEFIRRVGEHARDVPPGQWITGGAWDHERWPGAPLPRRAWIDSITPRHPVFLRRVDGHMALANTAALEAAGVSRHTPAPAGGAIVRDAATGEPLGIFKDNALALVARAVPQPSPEQRDTALARALAHAASLGLTAIAHVTASPEDLAAYRRLDAVGRLTLRAYVYLPLERWRDAAELAAPGTGGARVHIAGLKGVVDGSAGSRTAYFFEPYSDSSGYAGLMQLAEPELRRLLGAADSAGLQLAVHAIGDRANALLLQIFDSIARAHDVDGPRDRRFRDEHAQHLRQSDIARFARIPVVASMQPYHLIDDGRWLEKRVGPARSRWSYAFRSLLDAGARLAFGSDWTVAPLDPLLGVYAAVTRRTLDGRHPDGWVPDEKISVGEALRAYTAGNAWAVFAEHEWGTIAPGYSADLVVLDRNVFALPPESIPSARVRLTMVEGVVVYRAPG